MKVAISRNMPERRQRPASTASQPTRHAVQGFQHANLSRLSAAANANPHLARLGSLQRNVHRNVVQRWPDVRTGDTTYYYKLGYTFSQRHVAASKAAAMELARDLYDPNHTEGSHSAYVTVIYSDFEDLTESSAAAVPDGYDWAMTIDVDAVCMGPKGLRGANGDPGQMDDNVNTVVVAGYGAGTEDSPAKITHVSTSI